MVEKDFNEKESLELISRMIHKTQDRVVQGSGTPFILCGYTTVFVGFLIWFLISRTGNYMFHWLWFLIPIILLITQRLLKRKEQVYVKTYVDRTISHVWTVIGITVVLVALLAMFYRIPILFLVILFISVGITITAYIVRFKPAIILGYIGILLAFPCVIFPDLNNVLYFSGVFVIMAIIPGHIINYKCRKHVQRA